MLETIDHVGIAVTDLETAVATYTQILGRPPAHRQIVERDGIEAVMFEIGGCRVELLGSLSQGSAIARFLERRGTSLHHLAFGVRDVQDALDHYRGDGLRCLDQAPRPGAGGRTVAFLHPSAAAGVLIELCQPRGSQA